MARSSSVPRFPIEEGDRTITSLDSASERWRAALETSSSPSIDQFLPPQDAPKRREALVALISIELDVRIRRNEVCRVEQFLDGYRELQSGDVLKLIIAELRARQARGEVVKRRDYSQRFPEQYEALKQLTTNAGSTVSRHAQGRPQPLRAGQSLGDYEILSRLGTGSYADVYLARQRSLGRDVALKVSLGKKSEGRTLGKLDHPNIVHVYSEHVVAGHQLLVMRYIPGKTWDEWLQYRQENPRSDWRGDYLLSWLRAEGEPRDRVRDDRETVIADKRMSDVASYLLLDLAKALAHAHDRGVLHLDIKPSNILLDMDGRGLLMDFNVAATPDENGIQGARPSGGTLAYMPPEQLTYFARETSTSSQQIDTRTDLYSLGVVMYELIADVSPWPVPDGDNDETVARQLLAQRMTPPIPLAKAAQSIISPGLAAIIDRLLDPDREARYPNANALVDDLKRWFSKRPLAVAHVRIGEQFKNWCWRNGKVMAIVAAVLLAIAFYRLGRLTRETDTAVANSNSTNTPEIERRDSHPSPSGVEPHPDSSKDLVDPVTTKGKSYQAPNALETENKAQISKAQISKPRISKARISKARISKAQIRPVVEVMRSAWRAPLNVHLRQAMSTGNADWELATNPMALRGVGLEDDWERKYGRYLGEDEFKRHVVNEAVTEVLLVQLVVHRGENEAELKKRFFARLPKLHKSLPLVRTLRDRLQDSSISEVSTSSLLAVAETEFERYLLAIVAAIRKEHETALTLFRRSKADNPDRHTTGYYYGLCAERADRPEEAIRAYRRCQEERPKFVPAYLSLGALYVRQKDLTLAAEQFRTAIEVAPRNPEVPMTLANVLLRLKMPQEAVKALDHLIDDLGKRTAPALTRRATAKLEADDRDGARDDLMEALELDSHFGLARQKLRVLNAGG